MNPFDMTFCRLLGILLSTFVACPTYSQITVGQSKADVINMLGQPSAEYIDGDGEVLWYLDNYRITMENRVVVSTRGSLHSFLPRSSTRGEFALSYKTSLGDVAQLIQVIDDKKQVIHCSIPNSRFNQTTIETVNGTNATILILRYSNDVTYTTMCFSNYFHHPGLSPNSVGVNAATWSDCREGISGVSDHGRYEFGCMWFPDGREYIGEFNNGFPTGFGVTISNSTTMFRQVWPACK